MYPACLHWQTRATLRDWNTTREIKWNDWPIVSASLQFSSKLWEDLLGLGLQIEHYPQYKECASASSLSKKNNAEKSSENLPGDCRGGSGEQLPWFAELVRIINKKPCARKLVKLTFYNAGVRLSSSRVIIQQSIEKKLCINFSLYGTHKLLVMMNWKVTQPTANKLIYNLQMPHRSLELKV
jgi:hypothetical protein